ncbi:MULTISPECIES: branched-chain amino acid ABC transporter permease [unclassified Paracoccus (in: a-proteobacteria)]|uniref:branched-chain amino acid ABC transporter permease n=1 Tax=unclassified Paracoccus (in: a-proteobacteria) TaxID=2688777 RepID=UPI001125BC72|nr:MULTISPECIES: branched-chain amino acid ABC transporter permease [unclassified Paracoccus (in: a-proteobacteria)]MBT0782963.1 branched-chain amino acid ABC transporter permease [Paracoccus sp. pheM1]
MIPTLILNALAVSSLYIMMASGLALIFGLRRVMNFGHGAIYMVGAYLGYTIASGMNFWAALILVPLIMSVFGVLLELLVLRPLEKRQQIEVALITFGIGIVIAQIVIRIYGGTPLSVSAPPLLASSIKIFGADYPVYRLFITVIGLCSVIALAVWLNTTRTGMFVRAVSHAPDVSSMMGINANRLSLLISTLSTAFAGLAGVLVGPYLSIDPGMDVAMIITCMIVVVIGGTGSIWGAILAALIFGFVQTFGTVYLHEISVLIPYLMLIAILVWRPQGLNFGGSAE